VQFLRLTGLFSKQCKNLLGQQPIAINMGLLKAVTVKQLFSPLGSLKL
jgi:hypothetical protein